MPDLEIIQGKSFAYTLQYAAPLTKWAPIAGITNAAPAIVTAPAHGIPDGWRVAVVSVKGMKQINAPDDPPKPTDYIKSIVLDVDTVELNAVNSSGYGPYAGGGYLRMGLPVDLSMAAFRMQIRASKTANTVLYELNSVPDPLKGLITVDNVKKAITLTIPVAHSALFAWKAGYYSVEMANGGDPILIVDGQITYSPDATHD